MKYIVKDKNTGKIISPRNYHFVIKQNGKLFTINGLGELKEASDNLEYKVISNFPPSIECEVDKKGNKIYYEISKLKLPNGLIAKLMFDPGQLSSYFANYDDNSVIVELEGVNNINSFSLCDCEVLNIPNVGNSLPIIECERCKTLATHKANLLKENDKLRQRLIDAGLEQPAIRIDIRG